MWHMNKSLVDLDPHWLFQGDGRRGQGVTFLCPCCVGTDRERRVGVAFKNPLDGGTPLVDFGPLWQREGETFETLTLSPSIDISASGHWHGFIRAGVVT